MAEERVKTGIKGLDVLLKGGIPEGLNVMVTGAAGTGKTTFGLQFLLEGIENYNEQCMLLTMHSEAKDIVRFYRNFGWDIEKHINSGKLTIKEVDVVHIEDYISRFEKELGKELDRCKAKRVVIDSLSSIKMFFRDEIMLNTYLNKIIAKLKDCNCTSVFVVESSHTEDGSSIFIENNSLFDGLIALYNMRILNTRNRAIEVIKMRGTDHDKDLRPFQIGAKGITVFPEQVVFSE